MTYKYKKILSGLKYCLLMFFVCVLFFGCATGIKHVQSPVKTPAEAVSTPKQYEGSLWRDNCSMNQLFIDQKARGVGDIVTISIIESAKASNKAATDTERKSSLVAGIDGFLGMEKRYPTTAHPYFNPFSQIKGNLDSSFEGEGTTTRSGTLAASITARITEVLPNGNLKIMGSRDVTVNEEKQMIVLTGIIRSRDISPDNIIQSTYISDAKITYTGEGVINDRQRPGWAARLLDWIWPF